MQSTMSLDRGTAVPGKIADVGRRHTASFIASEDLPFGVAVELNNGQVRLPRSTGQEAPIVGVTVWRDTQAPGLVAGASVGGYKAGDEVPVIRQGRVWVQAVGTAGGPGAAAGVSHSSTVATDRGKFTTTASNGTVGTEVTGMVGQFRGFKNTTTLALVELNIPAGGY